MSQRPKTNQPQAAKGYGGFLQNLGELMKKSALLLGTVGLALTGCFSDEPVEIPEDWDEAAQTCLVSESLAIGGIIGRDEDDPISLTQFSDTIQYLLIASTKGETFNIAEVMDGIEDLDPLADELATKDYEAAVPECKKRFGVAESDGAPELPESKVDAALSCYAMSSFIRGSMEESVANFGKKGEAYTALQQSLEAKLGSDPELLTVLATGDPEQMVYDGAKSAFAEGRPEQYLDACVARFAEE